ncbi:MAG: hypothetical protein PHS86_14620 [Syntrophaceae bacterium]|nr:hypothetical protein [Syntrophaceae bacterium]
MQEISDNKKTIAFAPWQALQAEIVKLGCKECEHLHGNACSGGEYPRLILLMGRCPRR